MFRYSRFILLFLMLFVVLNPISPASGTAIRQDNIGAVQLYNLAVDEATAGNFSQAENLTAQALAIQPNFTLALVTRASVLMDLGNMTGAREILDKAVSIDPTDASVLATMASLKQHTGEDREAVSYASKGLGADPTLIEAWIIKGTAHGSLGEYEEELNASEQALTIAPDNKLALSNKEYATRMLTKGKKTPVSLPVLVLALLVGAVLFTRQRM